MALRFAYLILFFYLLLLMFVHGSGARDIANHEKWKQMEVTDQKESNYITSYGPKHNTEKSGYVAAYGSQHGGYLVTDITKHDTEEVKDSSYTAAYGSQHGGYLVTDITKHDTEEVKDSSYTAAYGSQHGGYLIVDSTKQDKKEEKDSDYVATYGSQHGGYLVVDTTKHDKEEVKDSGYVAAYGSQHGGYLDADTTKHDTREIRDSSYVANYGSKHGGYTATDTTKHDRKHGRMVAKPSSHLGHLEAFKSGLFTMDNLCVGKTMAVRFPVQEFPHFLPRKEANSIPFSVSQLPSVLQLFSIPDGSPDAKAMENTIQLCESSPFAGEIRLCATSLESMLDFVNTIIGSGSNLNLVTTTHPTISTSLKQNYTIWRISEEIYAPKWVACHPLPYPYKVFFCHFVEQSKIFKVSLAGENGRKVEAVAVCHIATSDMDSGNALPCQGSSSICHFLPVHHLVWVPSPGIASI